MHTLLVDIIDVEIPIGLASRLNQIYQIYQNFKISKL